MANDYGSVALRVPGQRPFWGRWRVIPDRCESYARCYPDGLAQLSDMQRDSLIPPIHREERRGRGRATSVIHRCAACCSLAESKEFSSFTLEKDIVPICPTLQPSSVGGASVAGAPIGSVGPLAGCCTG